MSALRVAPSDMPQNSVIGPTSFSIFRDSMLTNFAGHTKFQGTANMMGDTKQLLLANWTDGRILKKLHIAGINLKFYIEVPNQLHKCRMRKIRHGKSS